MEQFACNPEGLLREHRVVARSLVPEKGMGGVEFQPLVMRARLFECSVDLPASFKGDVRILPAPHHEELAVDRAFFRPFEGIIRHAEPQTARVRLKFVDVGCVKADPRADFGMETGSEVQMTADANSEGAKFAGAEGVLLQETNDGGGIGIIGVEGFVYFAPVSAVGSRGVVRQDFSEGLELVENLRHRHEKSLGGEESRGSADGPCGLENLREQEDPRKAPPGGGTEQVGAHETAGRFQITKFVVEDGHAAVCRTGGVRSKPRAAPAESNWYACVASGVLCNSFVKTDPFMQTTVTQDPVPATPPGLSNRPATSGELSPLHQPPVKVERKFLVGELPKVLNLNQGRQVSQGYLAVENGGAEVRILRSENRGTLCVKTGSGQNQMETEVVLTPEQLAALWPLTEGRRMSKVSYTIDVGETPVSLDMYEGQLSWLRIAEAEFKSHQSADNFSPPSWFHREVTDVHAYRHSNLARE